MQANKEEDKKPVCTGCFEWGEIREIEEWRGKYLHKTAWVCVNEKCKYYYKKHGT